ncbi:MAG: hypothetical protein K0R52_657 [Alphaproteobacteria bacterium]|jgi:4-diphosphocytidyl-2C-methyl-D-erythritol kinase|nr:hypothetical protein [Alphaproteobacteria bacterium]
MLHAARGLPDGRHPLQSLVPSADVGDQVTVEKEDTLTCFALFEDENAPKAALRQQCSTDGAFCPSRYQKTKEKFKDLS